MSHDEVLNLILSHACSYDTTDEVSTYLIELHCTTFEVKAKSLGSFKYEVLSCKRICKSYGSH